MPNFFPWRKARVLPSPSPHENQSRNGGRLESPPHSTQALQPPTTSQVPLQVFDRPTAATLEITQEIAPRTSSPSKTSKTVVFIPEPKWGLFLLNPTPFSDINKSPSIYPIDIVAVHGITGSADSTWTHKDSLNETFWLRDFLPEEFPGARIFSYGYPADVFFSKERGDIGTFARTLLDKLNRERGDDDYHRRPIIFICHSMGGIVVKQALITAKIESEEYGSILKSVTDILFFATPHRGADSVKLLKILASIANIPIRGIGLSPAFRTHLIGPLKKESKELKVISTSFRRLLPELRIVSFIEQKVMYRLNGLIVDEHSGVMDDPREDIKHMAGCDHTTICQFRDQEDEMYKDVLQVLRRSVLRATNNILDQLNPNDFTCLHSLAFPEMTYRRQEADRAHPNTCLWILQHPSYMAWMHDPQGLLWVKGKPGSGKSTLMASIFKNFQILAAPSTHVNLSFFFHGRGTMLQRKPEGMFRSLLHQLYTTSLSARKEILKAFKEKNAFGEDWDWQVAELQDMFFRVVMLVAQWSEVTLFIDALDEAGSDAAGELVNYLHRLNDTSALQGRSIKICISCRHYPVVARSPGLEVMVEDENHRDILSYVHGRLGTEVKPRVEDRSFEVRRNELGNLLARKAGNVFQWVAVVVPRVIGALNDGESFDDVNRMTGEQTMELFGLYRDILENVINPRSRRRTVMLVQWVCLAERPLTVTELRFALASDDEYVHPGQLSCNEGKSFVESDGRMKMLINSLSGGLVEARQYKNGLIVQACHQTVKDFLLSGGLQSLMFSSTTPNNSMKNALGATHSRLMRCCMNYLRLGEVQSDERSWNSSWSTYIEKELPFIEYATKFLFSHAAKAEAQGAVQDDLVRALNSPPSVFELWAKSFRAIDELGKKCPAPGSSLIHVAATYNLQSVVSILLSKGIDVETEDVRQNRALHYATRFGFERLTAMLLDANADREAKNREGSTPLEQAARNGHGGLVKMLLKRGAKVNENTGNSGTALQSGCYSGNISLVRMLINNGADINAQGGNYGNALAAAATRGNEEIVRLLLDEGADVNADGGRYGTVLQAAASCLLENADTIAQMLLESGARVNAQGGEYGSALQAAASSAVEVAERLVKLLLDHGADVNAQGGEDGTAFQAAVLNDYGTIVQLLLDHGADIHLEGGKYGSALQAAAATGNAKIVKMLLNKGVKIDVKRGQWGDALHSAAYGCNKEIMQLLLDRGADINSEDEDFGSPLQAAARSSASTIQMLLDRGARVNTQTGEFGNVLTAAVYWGRDHGILKLLLDNGADINAKSDTMWCTAIQTACARGRKTTVEFLLDNGADVNLWGGALDGCALHTAARFGKEEIVELLLDRGADIHQQGFFGNVLDSAANARDHKKMRKLLLKRGAREVTSVFERLREMYKEGEG